MRMIMMLMLIVSSISLTACSGMAGNVVPQSGPTMEQVYDGMEVGRNLNNMDQPIPHEFNMNNTLRSKTTKNSFHKLENPEVKMYVFPHLAEKDEVPIPGYFTIFNVYTQDHYTL